MKEEIQKCFAISTISDFKPNFDCKRPYLNIVRSIMKCRVPCNIVVNPSLSFVVFTHSQSCVDICI